MPTKILVAVHGIGDQIGYSTVQSVATQLGAHYGIAPAIPLGRFYPSRGPAAGPVRPGPQLMIHPPDPKELAGIGLAEVYWAGIARAVARDGYILEETKKWARTIAARIALRASATGAHLPRRQYDRIVAVLDEMIETIFVLDRLTSLGKVTGVFKFNLKALLADFLGDVQIVSEFVAYRERILEEFDTVMTEASKLGEEPELYVVAHSEGSVVAFLALLAGLSDVKRHPWTTSVRGLMTIGSPIETHILLWPHLWDGFKPDPALPEGFSIPWRNYLDAGDPIAYPLKATRAWMASHKRWDRFLDLEEFEFSRSYLPGKAHVDYWSDAAVFGHFINDVVKLPALSDAQDGKGASSAPTPRPPDKLTAIAVSYVVPHVIVAAIFLAATYAFYRPVVAELDMERSAVTIGGDVVGIALLLLGMTVAARIPRLTDRWRWWIVSAGCLVLAMGAYWSLVSDDTRRDIGRAFDFAPLSTWTSALVIPIVNVPIDPPTAGTLMAAAFVALVSGFIASWWHRLGTRVLPTLGVILAGGIVGVIFRDARAGSDINVWPAMLGGIAFFYLWWLGALLFDLVFVWHRYIRHAAAMQRVGEIARSGYQPPPTVRLATQTVDSTVRLASQTADSAKNCAQYVANQSVRCASLVKGLTSRDNRKDDPPTS